MQITRYGRYWAVYDAAGTLVCVTVYRKGAREVARRLGPPADFAAPALTTPSSPLLDANPSLKGDQKSWQSRES